MRDLAPEVQPSCLHRGQIGIQWDLGELKPERIGDRGRVAAEGVTREKIAALLVKDHDRSRRVPRGIVDYERAVAEIDMVSVVNRLKVLRNRVIGDAAGLKQTLGCRP